jgi:hypothetical protein
VWDNSLELCLYSAGGAMAGDTLMHSFVVNLDQLLEVGHNSGVWRNFYNVLSSEQVGLHPLLEGIPKKHFECRNGDNLSIPIRYSD